jgi:hypothetical protein
MFSVYPGIDCRGYIIVVSFVLARMYVSNETGQRKIFNEIKLLSLFMLQPPLAQFDDITTYPKDIVLSKPKTHDMILFN